MLLDDFIRFLRIKKVKKYIPKNIVLCDLGCGPSAYLLNLLKAKIEKGVGIDKKIKQISKENLKLINFEIQKQIPLPDESINCLTMLAVLEHLDYPEQILKECWRVLKKNGYLIITVPSPIADPVLNFLAYKLKLIENKEIDDHKHYFSIKKLDEILKQTGFQVLKIKKFEFGFNVFILAIKI